MSLLKQSKQLSPGDSLPITIDQYITAKQYVSVLHKTTGYYYSVVKQSDGSFRLECGKEPFSESLRSKLRKIQVGAVKTFPIEDRNKIHASVSQMEGEWKLITNKGVLEVWREA